VTGWPSSKNQQVRQGVIFALDIATMADSGVKKTAGTKSVLLVDDEQNFLDSLVVALGENTNLVIDTAHDGNEAMAKVVTSVVDLVVTDLKMPGMSGFELIANLSRYHPRVRVIVMTAFGSPEMEANLLAAGVSHYLEKPIDVAELNSKIDEVLSRQESGASGSGPSALDTNLLGVLRQSEAGAVNGEVVVAYGERSARFLFFQGKIAWITASTAKRTFIMHLIDRAGLQFRDLQAVFEECERSRKNLAETIIEWRLVDRERMYVLLAEHLAATFAEVLSWPTPQVMFVADRRVYKGSLVFPLQELLDQAQKIRDERLNQLVMQAAKMASMTLNGSSTEKKENLMLDPHKLQETLQNFQNALGKALIATDVWMEADGQSLGGINPQPRATALFNQLTQYLSKSLAGSKFPPLSDYYMLRLDGDKAVIVSLLGKYQWGILMDTKEVQMGLVVNVILPDTQKALRDILK
jgi:YesN/AraC family two-component response regulator